MPEIQNYMRSLRRSHEARTRADRPSRFTLRGREWDLLDDVFAPIYSPSTGVALDFLGWSEPVEVPRSGSFLEVGCGTGVIAVTAALAGCDRVVATDINPQAAANARLNASRHGVAERFRAVQGDLFEAVPAEERFDLIFWSSNYVLAPSGYQYRSMHERAYVDTGYAAHRRFLDQATGWLAPGGAALLHFSSRGDLAELRRAADETGRDLRELRRVVVQEGQDEVDHMLLQVLAA
ncbi:methyltransferase domain-containing protein [Kitasatospora herbaricolor]|uniref:methyltransferase domain-containing protein n=1 Tax=Kitasatospora herbaricolor TaxID=68217 RepID=UPI0036DBD5C5